MRCPSCNKFAALEVQEPEVDTLEISDNDPEEGETERQAIVNYNVRLLRNSECCGDEMKEAWLEGEINLTIAGHTGEDCELSVDEENCEATEEGGGRYAKCYHGFELEARVSCFCGGDILITACDADFEGACITITDKVAASEMEELV
jgi:hypothetical protein